MPQLQPPKRALKFLRWFCREDFLGEIEGDLLELYYFRSETVNPAKARRLFWWDVLRSFRLINIKKIGFTLALYGMYRNYLITSLRNFGRHKSSFLINLTGLSTGLACAILIVLWIQDELRYDRFYPGLSSMFKVMTQYNFTNELGTGDGTPGPLANALKAEVPEVAYATVTSWAEAHLFTVDEKRIKASGLFGSEDFFQVFNVPLAAGEAGSALTAPNTVAISSSLAAKLFDHGHALGKEVRFDLKNTFLVTAVYEDFPENSSISADWVAPFAFFELTNGWVKDWTNTGPQTTVRLKEHANADAVTEKIESLRKQKGVDSSTTFSLYPYGDYYLYGNFKNGLPDGGRIEYVQLFGIIAGFIVLIACINFMNLATARSSRRSKEVGIRKAIGAQRHQLIGQFISESVLITLLSVVVAILLVVLALPYFNEITGKSISLSQVKPVFGLWLAGIALLVGTLAGSYPALYLSSFQAVKVLKGTVRGSFGEILARKGLVIFQFTLSIILIIATGVVYNQIRYTQNKDLGFNKENLMYFSAEGDFSKNQQLFTDEVRKLPGVISTSGSNHKLKGSASSTGNVLWDGKAEGALINFEILRTNYDFIETTGIQLEEGRNFSRDFATDTARILINEAAVRVMGLEDPVGKKISVWDEEWEIAGVVKDFHFRSIHAPIDPLIMMLQPGISWTYWIRLDQANLFETVAAIEEVYKKHNPEFPFDWHFLDEELEALYTAEVRVGKLSGYFSLFAVVISTLGLFGLSAYMAEKRTKEIGIRKILGASVSSLLALLTRDFAGLVLTAVLIAVPSGWFLMSEWLESFEYSIDLSVWYFIGASTLALLIALLTVSSQSLKAAITNPASSLRNNE